MRKDLFLLFQIVEQIDKVWDENFSEVNEMLEEIIFYGFKLIFNKRNFSSEAPSIDEILINKFLFKIKFFQFSRNYKISCIEKHQICILQS